ncbi:MAG TPA: EAL domain-containing protein [Pseudomonas sp.]|jgi:diguanylate cyclase (GGDEF)-like protein
MDWVGLQAFFRLPPEGHLLLNCSHDLFLMTLAYGVACTACFATLNISERVMQVENHHSCQRWQLLGALCLAGGIWAMHFIAMLAFEAPMTMRYDLSITLISLLVALLAGLIAIKAITQEALSLNGCLIRAVGIGLGIVVMHYLGMSALRSAAVQYYEPKSFALSILLAILSSVALIVLSRHLRQAVDAYARLHKWVVSMLLGAGLLCTHMTGMWSLRLALPNPMALHSAMAENTLQLGLTIAVIALLIIGGSIIASLTDKTLQKKDEDLRRVNLLLSQLDQARASLQQVAHYDPLTNLINRRGFNQIFAEKLLEYSTNGAMLAVMFLDIDHFKRINDSLGHDAGDELLKAIGERIRSATRVHDVVARLGGDEFCILISMSNAEEARHLANRVMQKMKEPIVLAGRRMVMTASLGISIFPEDGQTCDELLKNADLALYQSKGNGRNRVNFFSPNLKTQASHELHLEEELRNALREGSGLQLHYQPIVDLRVGKIAKLEALVRWEHPVHGLLTPDRFIRIAEANGLIVELDNWVLRRACRDLSELTRNGLDTLIIAVNWSALNLSRSDLVEEVRAALSEANISPARLEMEVTENALMCNISNAINQLRQIRGLGMSLSIDDFGSGYSSLAYLKRLPLDTVKIDRSFIVDTLKSPQDMEIVQAIIVMAHTLRLKVVAEGVETTEQLNYVKQYGCDYVQGNLFSRPRPLKDLLNELARDTTARWPVSTPKNRVIALNQQSGKNAC